MFVSNKPTFVHQGAVVLVKTQGGLFFLTVKYFDTITELIQKPEGEEHQIKFIHIT